MKHLAARSFFMSMVIIMGVIMPSFSQGDETNEIWARGVIQGVDKAAGEIVLRHEPIPDIGWPEMTMKFSVVDGVSLDGLEPESQVDFSLIPQADGQFLIEAIKVSE